MTTEELRAQIEIARTLIAMAELSNVERHGSPGIAEMMRTARALVQLADLVTLYTDKRIQSWEPSRAKAFAELYAAVRA